MPACLVLVQQVVGIGKISFVLFSVTSSQEINLPGDHSGFVYRDFVVYVFTWG